MFVYDLHGLSLDDGLAEVQYQLDNKPRVIIFITGQGWHSPNSIPILRPSVVQLCRQNRYIAFVDKQNQGRVVAKLHHR